MGAAPPAGVTEKFVVKVVVLRFVVFGGAAHSFGYLEMTPLSIFKCIVHVLFWGSCLLTSTR